MELNEFRITIYLRRSEVSIERVSACNANENLMEHGLHCLPCYETNDVIYLLPKQVTVQINV